MSFSTASANAGKPNSIFAEMRESVLKGATVSGASGGLSAADAIEQKPTKVNAASAALAERRDFEVSFMTGLDSRDEFN
jgi:hypothetical protein